VTRTPGATIEPVAVPGWPTPRGYVNGALGTGRALHVAGQIGWEPDGSWVHHDLVGQFGRALDNVLAVLRAAGAGPEHVASMTVYVTDVVAYRTQLRAIGQAWRERWGKVYPAMALVAVSALVEPSALVEIQVVGYVPDATHAPDAPAEENTP
jgi:enamine deaminase RidA (YjgF/YER057c/UK114 family)